MKRKTESGMALIMTLLMVLVASTLAVSLAFISRSESFSSVNYRLMSQARDAAEAGVNKTANFLMSTATYTPPTAAQMGSYVVTETPVTYNGSPVVLSGNSYTSSNYPVSGTQSSFNSAAQGGLTAGSTALTYAASARLLAMRLISEYGVPTPGVIQTWEITSDGNVAGIQNANVRVTAILEQQAFPAFSYAAFATSPSCGALQFGGGGHTGSYDSTNPSAGTQNYGGNVGTNGNLSTAGSPTTIYGSLSTPRSGVGSCSTSNVTAWTGTQGTVTGGLVELPQAINYPTPNIPPPGTVDIVTNGGCPTGTSAIAGCSILTGGHMKLDAAGNGGTMNLHNITLTGNKDLTLTSGTYNINSITENGNTVLHIDSSAGPVILNVTGNGITGDVIKLNGGGISNPSASNASLPGIPMNLQILYAGTQNVKFNGGATNSALLYAPNASLAFSGGANWYGAAIAGAITDFGGAGIIYDRNLQNTVEIKGNYTLSSFSWKKY